MGKKAKVGKQRKDKFYHLAKETGYRARSAFKLIQLNRKFGFLQKSRCVIDLCAAPGGWLQVASKFMPISSIIVGVDLVPIKPIKNVITFQEDITSERCKQLLRKELKTWKADCVLNDGAPNVGTTWIQDAFSQAQLTLSALKLACENLREGGWFITKVFRSRDYQPLLWVFQQLFKKVHSTKPQASRNESAEIFVVCQGYIAPHKIDPKMLDPKYVFKEVQPENQKKPTLLNEKQKKRAEGYTEGDYTLFNTANISDFIKSESPLELLTEVNQIVFDDDAITNHKLTTDEIKDCFKDIKVLGKPDVRNLLAWHRHLRKEMYPKDADAKSNESEKIEEDDEETTIQNTIQTLREEEDADIKRQKRKVQQQRQKLREKMQLKMVLPGDTRDIQDDAEVFSLAHIRSKKHLDEMDDIGVNLMDDGAARKDDDDDEEELELQEGSDMGTDDEMESDDEGSANENEEHEIQDTSQSRLQSSDKNPLLVDLQEETTASSQADMWFEKDVFKGVEDEQDEDLEISQMLEEYKKKGGKLLADKASHTQKPEEDDDVTRKIAKVDPGSPKPKTLKESIQKKKDQAGDSDDSNSSESDSDSDYSIEAEVIDQKKKNTKGDHDFEVVPPETASSFARKLTPEGLALGAQMAFSRKRKRDIIDDSYHRWSFNDMSLPSWFVEDETRCYQRQLPITSAQVAEYKARLKEIDARPIKKIAEAKGRKKRKEMKRMERARKKAEVFCEAPDVTPQEKMKEIKRLYKKATDQKKKEIKYVVTKKHQAAKRMKRPTGVKGPFKVVDPRMKKDMRAKKNMEKGNKKKGRRGKR